MRNPLFGAALASLLLLASTPAFAEKATAEALYKAGMKMMEEGKFEEACPKFAESLKEYKTDAAGLALANCYDKAGKTASAWAQYREIAFNARENRDSAREAAATKKADELEKRLSKLQIDAADPTTPGLEIRRDGQVVGQGTLGTPVPVDPGEHLIQATAPDYNVWSTKITIGKANDLQKVAIPALIPVPKPIATPGGGGGGGTEKPSTTLRTAGFIVGGVGVAGLAVGATFGILAMGQVSSAEDDAALCPNKQCTPAGRAEIDSANTKSIISSIGIGVGAAALATGVVLVIVGSPKKEAAPPPVSATLVPSFGSQGGGFSLVGAF